MDKFLDSLQEKLGPIALKLNENKYLGAVRDGFMGAMSLLILGSLFLLFANLPIPGYADLMANTFGNDWAVFFNVPYDVTMNIMTLFVIIGLSRSLAKSNGIDDLGAVLWALIGFLILTPVSSFEVNSAVSSFLPMNNFSASGLFLGMLSAILAVEIMAFVLKRGWRIKLPESVPSNVAKSFDALIPGLFIILIFMGIRMIFEATLYETAQAFIFQIIQTPLTSVGTSLPATVLVIIIETVLFSFGLHGPNIIGGVMQPLWLSTMAENLAAFQAGLDLPNIVTYQFYGNFIKVGGAGGTIGLALLCLFVAKSQQFKTLGKLAIGPSIFNINEPLIFGLPIVLNPVFIIPFVITPVVLTILTYIVMTTGLVPPTNGVNVPWTTPPIFSGFLVSGWRGALWQVMEIGISTAIYFPFFRMEDQKALALEKGQSKEVYLGSI
ncbi:PTS sugar transporter subunit IIC [Desemzia incerta]|uniref:PTS sugar transporter subunit IIC n=1 Tax=Desemzia incerta TaxID=82801 RepID=UPI003314B0E3